MMTHKHDDSNLLVFISSTPSILIILTPVNNISNVNYRLEMKLSRDNAEECNNLSLHPDSWGGLVLTGSV